MPRNRRFGRLFYGDRIVSVPTCGWNQAAVELENYQSKESSNWVGRSVISAREYVLAFMPVIFLRLASHRIA